MTIIQNIKSAFSSELPVAAEASVEAQKGTLRSQVIAYKEANPSATCTAIGRAIGTSAAYAYQVLNPKPKAARKAKKAQKVQKVAVVKPNAAKKISDHKASIWSLEHALKEALSEVQRLKDDNYLFVKRELKLMGVIDYLESKVKNGSAV